MSPNEAFIHMKQILEQFNAITATLFTQERIEEDARKYDVMETERSVARQN